MKEVASWYDNVLVFLAKLQNIFMIVASQLMEIIISVLFHGLAAASRSSAVRRTIVWRTSNDCLANAERLFVERRTMMVHRLKPISIAPI